MTSRPRANEIPDLVRRLGSRTRSHVDSAKARLSILGGRAVEALIDGLHRGNDRVRTHAVELLALIQDPRGREPTLALLHDEDPAVRRLAATNVARYPTRDTAAGLVRALRRDEAIDVRVACAHALIELYGSGRDEALAPLLDTLFDESIDSEVRRAAFGVVRRLPEKERRCALERLAADRCPTLAALASRPRGAALPAKPVDDLLEELAARDYAIWNVAVLELSSRGSTVVDPLVEEMCRRRDDAEYGTRAGMVLKAIGPRRGRAVADWLERVDEPWPLGVLVEVVSAYGVRALIYRLKDLIERIEPLRRDAKERGADVARCQAYERVRAKAHLALARIGSRVAVRDLRDALGAADGRLELELLGAVELIGKRDELLDLVRAYRKEDRFMQDRIAEVVRAVMRRERIRRNSTALKGLGADNLETLVSLLDRGPHRTGRTPKTTRSRAAKPRRSEPAKGASSRSVRARPGGESTP